jgi:hypothetical protein
MAIFGKNTALEARVAELERVCIDLMRATVALMERIDDRKYVAYQHLGPSGVAWQAGVVTTAHWPAFSAANPTAQMVASPTSAEAAFAIVAGIEQQANETAGNA